MTGKSPKDTAAGTAATAKDEAATTMAETMKAARHKAAETAESAGEALKNAAAARASAAKDTMSDKGDEVAEKLRDAADAREGTFHERFLDIVADGVSGASDDLRGMSLGSIITRTEEFARRHTGAFVAGAAVAGFALARFAQASSPQKDRSDDERHITGMNRSSGTAEDRGTAALVAGHPRPQRPDVDNGGGRP